ncbi:hypothetical protein APHAL10511_005524 [Amanita phalloides]|nr:hypothetical protein APHAL10511_005524 [Amanita phalloides]
MYHISLPSYLQLELLEAQEIEMDLRENKDGIEDEKLTVPIHADDVLLSSLGYKQEFKRNFTPIEVFGIGFSVIGLVPSIASVLIYSIPYGGPSAMIWG